MDVSVGKRWLSKSPEEKRLLNPSVAGRWQVRLTLAGKTVKAEGSYIYSLALATVCVLKRMQH